MDVIAFFPCRTMGKTENGDLVLCIPNKSLEFGVSKDGIEVQFFISLYGDNSSDSLVETVFLDANGLILRHLGYIQRPAQNLLVPTLQLVSLYVPFLEPGRYYFGLFCNGEVIARYPLVWPDSKGDPHA